MGASLVLIRHGASNHVHAEGALDRRGVERWRSAYDAAGIQTSVRPPDALVRLAAAATHVIASDMRRASESAALLAPQRTPQLDARFREAPLEIPAWPTRLPLRAWGTIIYLRWRYQTMRGTEVLGEDRARAADAARYLSDLAADGATVCVITHGVFRSLLADQLREQSWSSTERRDGYAHWSSWHFARP